MKTVQNPLILQSDQSILVEVDHPRYEKVRDTLSLFAELLRSPEHIHSYRLTPISLWNAASSGVTKETILSFLNQFSRYAIPETVQSYIETTLDRFGKLCLYQGADRYQLRLFVKDSQIVEEIQSHRGVQSLLGEKLDEHNFAVSLFHRGTLKQKLIELGYPVEDEVGFQEGEKFVFSLRESSERNVEPFLLRDYQKQAVDAFYCGGNEKAGYGAIVMPCGSGKTIVGMGIMEKYQTYTLVVTSHINSLKQWISEIRDKTDIPPESVGEFSSQRKEIRPITVTTYQILIQRKSPKGLFPNFHLFTQQDWGLIIYDEVHLLPAPLFRITAEIQSRRRLGLTATLIREDGKEREIFSLIGPKRFDVPWKELEKKRFIAEAHCYEIRIPLSSKDRLLYLRSDPRTRFRLASCNNKKLDMISNLLKKHHLDSILIIGQYIHQLEEIKERFKLPWVMGKTPTRERETLYQDFRIGKVPVLVVSRVANYALDLPSASVAIQVSGAFGSRQEEAQRLGRILRPKDKKSYFYSLVSENSWEEELAHKRQLFLTEQGYQYSIQNMD